jgi:beta-lactamase class A
MSALSRNLEDLIAGSGVARVGLATYDLATNKEVLISADEPFHPASTFKVCVMMEVFRQARAGMFSLDDSIPVKNEFASIADGSRFSLASEDDSETDLYDHIGTRLGIRDLLERMVTRSSNLATNILIELVTAARVTEFMQALGAPGLAVRRGPEDNAAFRLGLNNSATARGLTHVLIRLAKQDVVSAQDSDEMIEILSRQYFNEGIPAGLPAGVRVAHKTGWNENMYHDTAIVFPPDHQLFVLSVLTTGLEETKAAPELVASAARLVYEARGR